MHIGVHVYASRISSHVGVLKKEFIVVCSLRRRTHTLATWSGVWISAEVCTRIVDRHQTSQRPLQPEQDRPADLPDSGQTSRRTAQIKARPPRKTAVSGMLRASLRDYLGSQGEVLGRMIPRETYLVRLGVARRVRNAGGRRYHTPREKIGGRPHPW